jgi:hypothetical protein
MGFGDTSIPTYALQNIFKGSNLNTSMVVVNYPSLSDDLISYSMKTQIMLERPKVFDNGLLIVFSAFPLT